MVRHRQPIDLIYIYGNFGAGRNEWAQEKGTACFRQRFRPRYRDGGTTPREDGTNISLYCIVLLPLLPLSVPEAFASGSQFTPPQTVCEARLDWRWG